MNNICVTGGAGFIGSHFIEFIQELTDSKIIVLDSLTYAADLNNITQNSQVEFTWCDIVNEKHVNYIFNKYKPTKVFHFAAESHVDNSIKNYRPFLESNVIGTINLMNASLSVNIEKFHFISTDEVYGSLEYDDTQLFSEESQIDPTNPYSASKAAAEHYVKTWNNTYDLPYLITSCSNNYGIRQHKEKLIPKVIINASNNKKTFMYGGGEQIRDWLHVVDHCRAIWSLEKNNIINDKFNIGGACELKNIEVTKKVLDIMGKSHNLVDVCFEDNLVSYCRPGLDSRYGTDFSKLNNKTGWKPVAIFDHELELTVRWYCDRLLK